MNTKSIIEIFRGDDSDALGYQTIVGTIHTDLDLTGCKAVFRYLGFFQEFDPIPEDGKLTIVIPSASSMQFPPGFGYASLKVYDIDRKVRTFTNRIPVFVKTMTPCRGGGEFDVEFSPFPELAPLKIFKGPNADDFDLYTGFLTKIIDRASAQKYGLSVLFDAMDAEKTAEGGCAASPAAVKAAYDAIIATLADNYYTAEQTDEAIDRVAAYYITYDAAGNPFPTYAALANATTMYSGGKVRVPTRNDYCVVLADETHQGAEYRYIYAVAEGQTTGSWQAQFPVEGVMTVDQTVQKNSQNPVSGGGVWAAIWGALSALPTGFTSLYDWCVAQLAGKASTADATLTPTYSQTPTFSEWAIVTTPDTIGYMVRWKDADTGSWVVIKPNGGKINTGNTDINAISLAPVIDFATGVEITATRTRTDITGYVLGSQSDKPLASEAEAEALRNGKQSKIATSGILKGDGAGVVSAATAGTDFQAPLSAQQLANIAAVSDALAFDATHSYAAGDPVVYNGTLYTFTSTHTGAWTGSDVSAVDIIARLAGKANRASPATAGNLASLDASGNPKDSSIPKTDVALKANIPYSLVTQPIVNNAVILEDRASNSVTISATLSPNTLTINFLPALIGKVRDFAMRLNIAAGVTAPEIAWPQGVTLENDGGEVPEIADGGTGGSSTILYFSETENNGTTAKFLVKGETLTAIAQA